MRIEERFSLARATTIGTGGPARWFARPETIDELEELLEWAREEGHAVEALGLGSNVLVHDDGVDALVVRLAGELATVRIEGRRSSRAAARPTPSASTAFATQASGAWSSPRDPGHGRRRRADERRRLGPRLPRRSSSTRSSSTPTARAGHGRRARARLPALGARGRARWSRRSSFGSRRATRREIRANVAEFSGATEGDAADEQAHVRERLQEPEHELGAGPELEECGLKGHRIGGAQISPRHANFIENAGGATSADALALMAEARRRVLERFGVVLEHEVRFLGPLELPPL